MSARDDEAARRAWVARQLAGAPSLSPATVERLRRLLTVPAEGDA